jgi:hypothetical protein
MNKQEKDNKTLFFHGGANNNTIVRKVKKKITHERTLVGMYTQTFNIE